jgi:predicted dinucleotide-binding enzyme
MTIQLSRRTAIAMGFAFSFTSHAHAGAAPMRIGVIGAGRMGSAVGTLLARAGHQVMFSARGLEEAQATATGIGAKASAGSVAEAVAFGEIVILLVPYSAMPEIAKAHGAALAKKPLVLDVSNPILPRDGAVGEQARKDGPGTYLATLLPGAKLVRAFNALNYAALDEFSKRGEKVGVPIAGDDAKALEIASTLAPGHGFRTGSCR